MKVIRRLFGFCAIVFFFVLGISVADKEYLSKSVVAVCIIADDYASAVQLRDAIDCLRCYNTNDLYQQIVDSDIGADVRVSKEYFNGEKLDMGCFPDGVYDTVVIDLIGEGNEQTIYFKQLAPTMHRFVSIDFPFADSVQKYYISFLSIIGKAEKYILDITDSF